MIQTRRSTPNCLFSYGPKCTQPHPLPRIWGANLYSKSQPHLTIGGDCRCMVVRSWSTGGLNWLMTMQLFYVRKEDKQGSLHLHPTHAKIVEIKSPIKGKMRPLPPPPPKKKKKLVIHFKNVAWRGCLETTRKEGNTNISCSTFVEKNTDIW